MALSAAEIESADPSAWTGKVGALTYDSESDATTWLTRRGYTELEAASAGDQEIYLIKATEAAEDAIRSAFRGRPVTTGQGLLFPAYGAYDGQGVLITPDTAPDQYLEGIRLIAEELAAGTWMLLADSGVGAIRSERTKASAVEYRDGVDASSIQANHPGIWRKLRQAVPRMI